MLFPLCLAIVVLSFVGLLTLLRAIFTAPHGEEDEHGFHVVSLTTGKATETPVETTVVLPDLAFFHR